MSNVGTIDIYLVVVTAFQYIAKVYFAEPFIYGNRGTVL